ncbi:NAD(P)-dependent dehydrogenase (short-subunit alcohol dehydrogenase family) [Paenibacillus endophyticus]|uniref:NAD(P)-dependent dehydrogenase (Short-subunit alcohol dehydrogenase family) n=1 Tax=Paenibacillus endophyticus TaxID=1294268 RepID=A0A7W5C3V6_9BACL|nr:NAD(P)-dependent dehydrogenase (short-subunit alcohol dehydrogenase family) [Paenibacillus endophyticus]
MQDRVAIITGAAGGIGRGIAEVLLREGCRVVIADWNEELGRQAAEELEMSVHEERGANAGNRVLFQPTDVSNPRDIERLMGNTLRHWNRIDILVNNVGTHFYRRIEQVAVEDWDRVMATDLRGHFFGIREVLPYMKSRNSGRSLTLLPFMRCRRCQAPRSTRLSKAA